jgi:hypothetical protein
MTYSTNPKFDTKSEKLLITGGEFGWGWDKFNDTKTKLDYYLTSVRGEYNPEIIQLIEILGNKQIEIEYNEDSYIDHQSDGDLCDDIPELVNWILDENSWLFIGDDNSDPPVNFYSTEELPYLVSLEGCETVRQYDPSVENLSYENVKPYHLTLEKLLGFLFQESNFPEETIGFWELNKIDKENNLVQFEQEIHYYNPTRIHTSYKTLKYQIRKNPKYVPK